jgi:cyclophilin family peptidyl-prolyl cis-trans isomerase
MARTNDPHSATTTFFITLTYTGFLDHTPGNPGNAVFGRVTSGLDVIDAIAGVMTGRMGMPDEVPVERVVIETATKVAND